MPTPNVENIESGTESADESSSAGSDDETPATGTPSDASFETTVEIRRSDMGQDAHVTNSRYVEYMDLARERYLQSLLDRPLEECKHVVAHLELDYVSELRHLGSVTVGIRPTSVGRTSLTLAYAMRYDGDVAAEAETVIVFVDGPGEPAPIPDQIRAGLDVDE